MILLVIDQVGRGGAGRTVLKLCAGLRRRGADARIVVLRDRAGHRVDEELPVHAVRPSRFRFPIYRRWSEARELRRTARALHAEAPSEKLWSVLFLRDTHRAGIRAGLDPATTFVSFRTSIVGDLARKAGAARDRLRADFESLVRGHRVVACSRAIADEVEALDFAPRTVDAIYNPYDFDAIRSHARAFEPDVEGPYVLHVGRPHPQKRHDLLFEAWRRARPSGVRLVTLGADMDTDDDSITSVPFQENPFPWIRGASALVCTSDYEGFPNVLVEALALGTPVVSTDCPTGPAEILAGTAASKLVPVGDVEGVAAAVCQVLDAGERETRAPILEACTEDRIIGRWLELFELPCGSDDR